MSNNDTTYPPKSLPFHRHPPMVGGTEAQQRAVLMLEEAAKDTIVRGLLAITKLSATVSYFSSTSILVKFEYQAPDRETGVLTWLNSVATLNASAFHGPSAGRVFLRTHIQRLWSHELDESVVFQGQPMYRDPETTHVAGP